MDKKIEDYLHLYLGCQISRFHYRFDKQQNGKLTVNTFVEYYTQAKIKQEYEIKPILRPLSDMSEEERVEQDYLINLKFAANYRKEDSRVHEARITKYLLSKHFDLFGLIEAGLAINKTTIK